jgi:hypothetical protein
MLLVLLLLLAPMPRRANSRTLHVPFRTEQSMILIEGKIDEKRVTFLLDTGSVNTIVNIRSYRTDQLMLPLAQRNRTAPGFTGQAVHLRVTLSLEGHTWVGQSVGMMNLDGIQQALGIRFDGLLGQDILREFRSVRIDYSAHVIELES